MNSTYKINEKNRYRYKNFKTYLVKTLIGHVFSLLVS